MGRRRQNNNSTFPQKNSQIVGRINNLNSQQNLLSAVPVFCVFCLKEAEGRRRADNLVEARETKKICAALQRYLNVRLDAIIKLDFHYCENCEHLLDKISELHGRLRRVEVELEWKVGQLKDIMTLASRVPSRLSFVRGVYSAQGNPSAMEHTQEWRGSVVRKCRTKLSRSLPKVQMRKVDEVEEVRSRSSRRINNTQQQPVRDNCQSTTLLSCVKTEGPPGPSSSSSSCLIPSIKSEPQTNPDSDDDTDASAETPPSHSYVKCEQEQVVVEVEKRTQSSTYNNNNNNNNNISSSSTSLSHHQEDDLGNPPPHFPPAEESSGPEEIPSATTQESLLHLSSGTTLTISAIVLDQEPDCCSESDCQITTTSPFTPDDTSSSPPSSPEPYNDEPFRTSEFPTPTNNGNNNKPLKKGHHHHPTTPTTSRRLRTHYRCSSCQKTFASAEKLDSHRAAELHDDDHDDTNSAAVHTTSSKDSDDSDRQSVTSADDWWIDEEAVYSPTLLEERQSANDTIQREEGEGSQQDNLEDKERDEVLLLPHPSPSNEKRHQVISNENIAQLFKVRRRKQSRRRAGEKRRMYEFECTVCKKVTRVRSSMRRHFQRYHDVAGMESDQVQRCDQQPQCSAYFRTQRQLVWHRTKAHLQQQSSSSKGRRPPPPDSLHPPERPQRPLINNSKERGGSRSHWCAICQKRFPTSARYKSHHKACHDLSSAAGIVDPEKVFNCGQAGCSAYFLSVGQLRFHLARRHGTYNNSSKKMNNRRGWKQRRHVCSVCSNWYFDTRALRKHYKMSHDLTRLQTNPEEEEEEKKVHKCDQPNCTAYFLTARQLASHRGTVHDLGVGCETCGKEFATRSYLRAHRETMHRLELDLKYICNVAGCGKGFEAREDLDTHYSLIHYYSTSSTDSTTTTTGQLNNNEAEVCALCGKMFRGPRALRAHLKSHDPARTLKSHFCEQCGKSFKDRGRLALHILAHSGPDSWEFQCSTCDKKCISQNKLEEHRRTHTGEKPWVCQHCGVAYGHKHNLRIHVNSKHPEAPDLPRVFDKTNLSSRKGIKNKRRKVVVEEDDGGSDEEEEEGSSSPSSTEG